jgi:hypothetical protein
MRGLPASPSTTRGVGPYHPSDEKKTKHRDDLANPKLILTILSTYIPPLSGVVNRDNIPRDFEYALVTVFLPKGIRAVRANQDKITTLKFGDFKLGDRKVYNMLSPHKYLTRIKGKNSKVIPQAWTHNLAQSTLLNVMKIAHFGRHQEVNACVKMLLYCYHGRYLWLKHRIIVDLSLINGVTGLSMQRPDPQDFYLGKAMDQALAKRIKDTYGDVEKGRQDYKVASIHNGVVFLTC